VTFCRPQRVGACGDDDVAILQSLEMIGRGIVSHHVDGCATTALVAGSRPTPRLAIDLNQPAGARNG